MVGHTGDIKATVVACKAADEAVKVRMINKILLHYLHMCERLDGWEEKPVFVSITHFTLFTHFMCLYLV
jgi:hypothetical protein